MKNDNYGRFVDNYVAYTELPGGMEYELGRRPALRSLGRGKGIILNFGCGPAVNSKELRVAGKTVIGIDVSEEELQVARELDAESEYIHYDGLHLAEALSHRKVDGILASFSFCAIPDGVLVIVLRDMCQLLQEGGSLVIVEPNLEKALGVEYRELHYHAQVGVKSGDHVHVTLGAGESALELYHDIYRTHADYRELLEDAGFTIDKMEEPKPDPSWGEGWETESKYPPFLHIIARKGVKG